MNKSQGNISNTMLYSLDPLESKTGLVCFSWSQQNSPHENSLLAAVDVCFAYDVALAGLWAICLKMSIRLRTPKSTFSSGPWPGTHSACAKSMRRRL